jgi:hypothetical protein
MPASLLPFKAHWQRVANDPRRVDIHVKVMGSEEN